MNGGQPPKPPGFYAFQPVIAEWLYRSAIPAAESALGLRPRRALPSARLSTHYRVPDIYDCGNVLR